MFRQKFLYDFGVAQDDPCSEIRALKPVPGDSILCIASAGEVPLELLVNSDASILIDAVDIDYHQLYLSNLKLQAALTLENWDAARFLGFLPADQKNRIKWFELFESSLPKSEANFWKENFEIFKKGPIHLGRYETYIARFAPLGRRLLGGRKTLQGLFECKGIEEQKTYFDEKFRTDLLKKLFRVIFHPRIYKNRGITEQGLQHMGSKNIGNTFYNKFRDFCTSTPVRKNWILQFVFFDRVIFKESLPSYLSQTGRTRLKEEYRRLRLIKKPYTEILQERESGYYNKFALSNVSDWLSVDEFTELLHLIAGKSGENAAGLIRYIYTAEVRDPELKEILGFNQARGEELLKQDRFPFYKLIPFRFNTNGRG
jgi:S-adenosylmethionine:diacylglycerol 3-amino-3-carboxypropyl transferase